MRHGITDWDPGQHLAPISFKMWLMWSTLLCAERSFSAKNILSVGLDSSPKGTSSYSWHSFLAVGGILKYLGMLGLTSDIESGGGGLGIF